MDQTPNKPRGGTRYGSLARALTSVVRRPGERPPTILGRLLPAILVLVLAGGLAIGVGALTGPIGSATPTSQNEAEASSTPEPSANLRTRPSSVPTEGEHPKPTSPEPAPVPRPAGPGTRPDLVAVPPPSEDTPEPTRTPNPATSGGESGSTASGTEAAGSGTTTSEAPRQATTQSASAPKALATSVIVNHGGGKCIDVTDEGRTGVQLGIWDCEPVEPWRTWTFYSDGTVRSEGHCMTAVGSGDGAPIQVRSCVGGAAQRFTLNAAHDLVNVAADKCVDVTDGRVHENGAPLQLWSCSGDSNQKWSL